MGMIMDKHCNLYTEKVASGFPSPAADYIERPLDLNEHLIQHQSATFFVRSTGDSMLGAGIHSGDLLIVDRAIIATDNSIILAIVNGEFTVKRLRIKDNKMWLQPENPDYKIIDLTVEMGFSVWGVVTNVIHSLTGKKL